MKPEQLALPAHADQIVRNAGKVKGESDDQHRVESNDHPHCDIGRAIAQGGLFAPAAVRADQYCSEDGYSFARNCNFSSMEQCKAAISGTYAACLRDPFLKDDSIETINHDSDTYLLLPSHRKRRSRPPTPTSRAKHSDAVSKITTLEATKSKKSSGVSRSTR
jgi:hypothetical protein